VTCDSTEGRWSPVRPRPIGKTNWGKVTRVSKGTKEPYQLFWIVERRPGGPKANARGKKTVDNWKHPKKGETKKGRIRGGREPTIKSTSTKEVGEEICATKKKKKREKGSGSRGSIVIRGLLENKKNKNGGGGREKKSQDYEGKKKTKGTTTIHMGFTQNSIHSPREGRGEKEITGSRKRSRQQKDGGEGSGDGKPRVRWGSDTTFTPMSKKKEYWVELTRGAKLTAGGNEKKRTTKSQTPSKQKSWPKFKKKAIPGYSSRRGEAKENERQLARQNEPNAMQRPRRKEKICKNGEGGSWSM